MKRIHLVRRHVAVAVLSCALSSLVLVSQGCGSDTAAPQPAAGGAKTSPAGSASASAASTSAATIHFNESDFSESESSRDPFHAFSQVVKPSAEAKIAPQYQVVLEQYGVDELKLVAIVSAGEGMKAMFVDPTGKGWVVSRGTHIGRGEMVKLGPGAATGYPLYWKIDRIKPSEVVLVREDALHPELQPMYREVPLHPEGGP